MSLTITIPGAVNVTTGATAPATLTVGVGVPGATGPAGAAGQGVPAGGTAGQFLTKIDGTNYNTDWTTVNLSQYLTISNAAATYQPMSGMSSYLTTSAAASTYAPLASPSLTGVPTAPTASTGTSSTQIATTAFVQDAVIAGSAHAESLQAVVRNNTGATLAPFTVVYINGALGNNATVAKAQANAESTSAGTFAVTQASIANNADGIVISAGVLSNIDTSAFADGDKLYLSPTTAGGVTTTKPSAPNHLVYVGVVTRSHPTLGTVSVRIQNGYELGEIHDVALASVVDNDLLAYNSATGLWNNESFSTLGLLTSASAASLYQTQAGMSFYLTTANASSTYQTLAGMTSYLTNANAVLTYAALATATFTGTVSTPASTTTITGFRILPGVAPTTPVNGDIWLTTSNVFARVNGVTQTLVPLSGGTFTGLVGTVASTTTTAGLNIPHGAAPTTPVNGDIWTTTAGLFARISGGTQQFPALGVTNTFTGTNTFSGATVSFGTSTAASTINIGTGATLTATTKAINIGTAGVSGSTTNIAIGSATSATTTTVEGTITANGATLNLGTSTAAATYNLGTGATLTATTKAVNIGTNGVAGSTTNIAIGSTTGTSTTTLQGTTNAVTAAQNTNTTQVATTAFVLGQASSTTPVMDGTAAVGTATTFARADHVHPTDTSRAPLASPTFTGTPAAPTAAVDTNTTQLATTAYVVGQGYAKLASPTFSGTPSLPTGTIAVTQTAGNNTTAVATTAFVTAAVPTFATNAQVVGAISATTVLAPANQGFALTNPRLQSLAFINGSSISGSGALASSTPQTFSRQVYLGSLAVGRACFIFGAIGAANAGFGSSTAKADQVDFSKKIWLSGYASMGYTGGTSYIGDANTICRISLGGYNTNTTGNMTMKGIGLKKVGGASSFVTLTVHNGTTLTDVASSVTVPDGGGIFWQIYSDGAGNVTLYINGSQAATTTAGPTTATASGAGCYIEQVEAATTPTVRQAMNCNGGWFYSE